MKDEYVSMITGEIVEGFPAVIKAIISDFKHYHFINLRWARFSSHYLED